MISKIRHGRPFLKLFSTRPTFRWFLLLLWGAMLTYLSLAPQVGTFPSPPNSDKLEHFVAYAVLAWLLIHALSFEKKLSSARLAAVWVCCSVFGSGLEVLQGLMALGRQCELSDVIANGLGALFSCVIFRHKAG